MNHPIQRRHLVAAMALGALPVTRALAQADWPARPVRLVVPGPPGGGTDVMGRLLADQLGAAFKQPFIVDNKPGANGLLASDLVAHAPADGYVLLFSYTAAMVINPGLFTRSPDPVRSFEPVAQIGSMGNVLLVTPDLPVNNLAQLIAYAKRQGTPMSYGSWGVGSGAQLTMESFLRRAQISMNHVPYKGVANLLTDMLGGVIQVGWGDVSSTVGHVKSGKLKALAVSGTQRVPQFPDVATMGEQGFAFDTTSWYGLFAPAKTPAAIVSRLNAEIARVVSGKDFRERLYALNQPSSPTPDPAAFRQRVVDDQKTWLGIMQDLGIKPE
ncbi:MAG: tripartite tricarboxylate transporter substrate binding protein [Proteobacteria bacterium]|nr:tripartite tricarboxylate transporter substrate binding protein [Pseudomonadota bacterium]